MPGSRYENPEMGSCGLAIMTARGAPAFVARYNLTEKEWLLSDMQSARCNS
jgi:hypothetical protein